MNLQVAVHTGSATAVDKVASAACRAIVKESESVFAAPWTSTESRPVDVGRRVQFPATQTSPGVDTTSVDTPPENLSWSERYGKE